MKKILCFGEVLLRMSPRLNGDWLAHQSMPVYAGGAELNVASALACWDVPVTYVTTMPDNAMAHDINTYLQNKGIDTSAIHYSGNRIGIYYLPQGTDLKGAGVIYDRAGSSFSSLQTGMIDWDKVLNDVSLFHFSAISPAVSESAAAVCKEALKAASAKGITISVDLNHRAKLWQFGKQPIDVMPELVAYCNIIMGNVWAANTLLGIPVSANIHDDRDKRSYLHHAEETCKEVQQRFPKADYIANTFRFDHGEKGIRYFASLYHDNVTVASPELFAEETIDKVGTGDCFMAGLLYGLHHKLPLQNIVNFGASAAYGKFFEIGDATKQTAEEIKERFIM